VATSYSVSNSETASLYTSLRRFKTRRGLLILNKIVANS